MTSTAGPTPSGTAHAEHVVRFYETDDYLLDALRDFVRDGFAVGDACLVVAEGKRRASLERRLAAGGLDVAAAAARGAYIWLDAADALAQIMVDGAPDTKHFARVIGGAIARASRQTAPANPANGRRNGTGSPSGRHVRVFGEMVALLWAQGNQEGAIRLEELWNEFQRPPTTSPFSLFCAYPMHDFVGNRNETDFIRICQQHSHVVPDESYTAVEDPEARLRAVALLQQRAASLEVEIAERKRAEAASAHLAAIVASAEDAIVSKTLDGIITSWNASAERMFGYSPEEIIGQSILRLIPPDRHDEEDYILARLRAGERVEHFETVRVTKDGRPLEVSLTISPIRDMAGTIIGASKIARDVTERRRMEAALRASEERLRFMAESMPQKIFTATPTGAIDYLNPQWMAFTGLSFESIRDWGWTQFIHPDDVEENMRLWRHSIETGEPFYFEHRFRRADGVYTWHMSRVIALRDESGRITMWVGSSTDIDEQKQLEVRKNAFISMASHELKTPVTSLKAFTQMVQRRLMQQQADPQTLHFLERMDAQLGKLATLIGELLDLSKMQTGSLALRRTTFDFDELVRETVENVQATAPSHRLEVQGQTLARVEGDRDRLAQVLINLLTNAVKYSPQADRVLVRLWGNDEQVEVAVQDFGIGIAPVEHERIFEQFYQVTDGEGSTYPGLGIGLHIARTLVERHGGRLWLESRPSAGSTFHFALPLPAEEADTAASSSSGAGAREAHVL